MLTMITSPSGTRHVLAHLWRGSAPLTATGLLMVAAPRSVGACARRADDRPHGGVGIRDGRGRDDRPAEASTDRRAVQPH